LDGGADSIGLVPQHEHGPVREFVSEKPARGPGGQTVDPIAFALQFLQRGHQLGHAHDPQARPVARRGFQEDLAGKGSSLGGKEDGRASGGHEDAGDQSEVAGVLHAVQCEDHPSFTEREAKQIVQGIQGRGGGLGHDSAVFRGPCQGSELGVRGVSAIDPGGAAEFDDLLPRGGREPGRIPHPQDRLRRTQEFLDRASAPYPSRVRFHPQKMYSEGR